MPAVVLAQSADSKYCGALADKYDAYLETAGDKGGRPTPVDIVKAMESLQVRPGARDPGAREGAESRQVQPAATRLVALAGVVIGERIECRTAVALEGRAVHQGDRPGREVREPP